MSKRVERSCGCVSPDAGWRRGPRILGTGVGVFALARLRGLGVLGLEDLQHSGNLVCGCYWDGV